jgi:hypothetical protein
LRNCSYEGQLPVYPSCSSSFSGFAFSSSNAFAPLI